MIVLTQRQVLILETLQKLNESTPRKLMDALDKTLGEKHSSPYYYIEFRKLELLGLIQKEKGRPQKLAFRKEVKKYIEKYLDALEKLNNAIFPS